MKTAPSSIDLLLATTPEQTSGELLHPITAVLAGPDAERAYADGVEVLCQLIDPAGDGVAIVYLYGDDAALDVRLAETLEWVHRTSRQPRWLVVVSEGPGSEHRRLDLEVIRAATSGCRWALVAGRSVYSGDQDLRAALDAHGDLEIYVTDGEDDIVRGGVAGWLEAIGRLD